MDRRTEPYLRVSTNVTTWRVDASAVPRATPAPDPSAVPLKWAHDTKTGEPRYNLLLTPVMAGQPMRVRPTAHVRPVHLGT